MPRDRRESLYLADIVEAARTVARWLSEHGDRWESDDILRNAVLRQLMVIGEAASNLSEGCVARFLKSPGARSEGFATMRFTPTSPSTGRRVGDRRD
jgi:uncharacterized protein with HEPN domain